MELLLEMPSIMLTGMPLESGPAELQATSASLRATPPSGQAELQATSAILPAILPETLAIGPATPARPWAALQRDFF